jgi:hypothetical protein
MPIRILFAREGAMTAKAGVMAVNSGSLAEALKGARSLLVLLGNVVIPVPIPTTPP